MMLAKINECIENKDWKALSILMHNDIQKSREKKEKTFLSYQHDLAHKISRRSLNYNCKNGGF